jgi:hypothetical protein
MSPNVLTTASFALIATISILVLIVWSVAIFTKARTQREAQRLELHTRLLERIGSAREFGEFLASDNGQRFLDAITPPSTRPQWRLLWALQGGIVLAAIGAAMFFPGTGLSDIGWPLMWIGLASIVACLVSWRVARAFGLVDSIRAGKRHRSQPPA